MAAEGIAGSGAAVARAAARSERYSQVHGGTENLRGVVQRASFCCTVPYLGLAVAQQRTRRPRKPF